MPELLVVFVLALIVIAASAVVGPRIGIASPLVLVAIGVGATFVPVIPELHIEPEWILEGVLPPLLYSSAVSMPSMNFRREFGAISGLSVLLVVGTSLVLGLFFQLVIPNLGFAWGVALGAIISPTDAVATSIIKQTSLSRRAISILDGESLLNDATALVLLRTAIVVGAGAAAFSFWGAVGTFAYSVVVAVVIGWLVGWANLKVRKRVTDPTVNTVISFTVPFLASVPVTLIGGSGLVAAVVAGLIGGVLAPRELSPENRLSDSQNWRTVELVLEGAVFLIMGLQIKTIVTNVEADHGGVGTAVLIATAALLLTILVRTAYVAPLLGLLHLQRKGTARMRGRIEDMQEQLSTDEGKQAALERMNQHGPHRTERDLERFALRLTRSLASIEYYRRAPLGWREGTAVVWAGMRGAVTVAAAQTLPGDSPARSVLVLIAFSVAVMSLLLQGGTIGPLVRRIGPKVDADELAARNKAELDRIFELLRTAAESVPDGPDPDDRSPENFAATREHRITVLKAQRSALLDARDNGTFDADLLEGALANLDASQIDLEMRGRLTA
jgi:CPA1 family monovalent cation:H+ antiporter